MQRHRYMIIDIHTYLTKNLYLEVGRQIYGIFIVCILFYVITYGFLNVSVNTTILQ
jgi:hypothetical protein